jgi:putative transposase
LIRRAKTVDFLLTRRRNKLAAHKFLIKAIANNGCPNMINIDKSGANREAIRTYNKRRFKRIRIRQFKYLNNRVEGDHRFIKWQTQRMIGFKSFESALRTFSGIEIVGIIKEGQVSFAMDADYKTFCSLVA